MAGHPGGASGEPGSTTARARLWIRIALRGFRDDRGRAGYFVIFTETGSLVGKVSSSA